jgi:Ni,Fe-hydrogenase I large subunit
MTEEKKTRIRRLEEDIAKLSAEIESKKKRKFRFRFPSFRIKSMMKRTEKKDEMIIVQYLTQKYGVKFIPCRVVGGNIIVVNNKVHVINPKTLYRFGKHRWYIYREIDRRPVSNIDYNKVKKRRDDTEADAPLIKAVLGAIQKPSLSLGSKNLWIVVLIIAAIGIVLYFLFGGG